MDDMDGMAGMDAVNLVDLAFVVDTTGSMGGLIAAAQRHMIRMVEELARAAEVALRVGVVEYRDHPPQDRMVTRVHPLTGDLRQAQRTILGLTAEGGGDAPEAVFDGVLAACRALDWDRHARRLAVLVGDAPPHGTGAPGDGFPQGCPCGETMNSVTRAAEEARITLYALGLTLAVAATFEFLSWPTGGTFFPAGHAEDAIERLAALLRAEFGDVALDRRVLRECRSDPTLTAEALAERVGRTRHHVASALVRLRSRDLLDILEAVGS